MTQMVRKWLPLAVLCGIVLRLALGAALPLTDPDVWWHLRLGEEFRDGGWTLLHPGQLSEFATVRWAPTQWLPEMVASWVEGRFGLPGVAWLFGLGLVGVVLSIYTVCRRVSDILPATVATGFAVGAATASLSPRPQIISFALLAVTVGAWLRSSQTGKPAWWLVPLSWIWAMCHGMWFTGAMIGAGVVVAMLLNRTVPLRRLAACAAVPVLSIAVGGLTPAGPRLLLAPFAVGERRTMITEWQPPSWTDGPPWVIAAMLTALAVLFARRRPNWVELALSAMAIIWLLTSARTVALSGVIVAPILAMRVQEWLEARSKVSRAETWIVAGTAFVALALLAVLVPQTADKPDGVPLALQTDLDALPEGTPIFNTWTLGGWLEWRHRNVEPVVDGLADAYTVEHLRGYIRTLELRPRWEEYIANTGARTALLTGDDHELADALVSHLGWRQIGVDDGTRLLVAP